MRCIEFAASGGPEVLRLGERPAPEPAAGQIAIRIAYAGVNRPDVLQRSGAYPPPPGASDLLGLEASGVVCALGPDAGRWKIGDRVTALLPGGGYAEIAVCAGDHALPVPERLSLAEAAALPETFFTVWANVFNRARLREGESFLVHGGASGIGTTAIQLARAFGVRVFATAGGAEKCRRCLELGAERVIDRHEEDFVEVVKAATDGRGVDVILDMVGGDYMQRNFRAAALEGRIASIAFLRGSKIAIDFAPAMLKRLTWSGSTLRARPDADKAEIAAALEAQVWPRVGSGGIVPVMDTILPLAEAADAHARMERDEIIGKLVLEVAGEAV